MTLALGLYPRKGGSRVRASCQARFCPPCSCRGASTGRSSVLSFLLRVVFFGCVFGFVSVFTRIGS